MRQEFLICLFLVLITLAAYWQIKNHEFTLFDDDGYVSENPHVRTGLNLENIRWAFGLNDFVYWHPLTWLSHMLDSHFYGLDSGKHHQISLVFHIVNSLLLFLIFNRMTGALWRSAFVAALFALHPLSVESVAWVAERKNVLSTFFGLLTLGAYAAYVERPGFYKYLLILLFFSLGLMAKPMLVTLPFVLLLLDYWPLGRFQLRAAETDYNGKNEKQLKSCFGRSHFLHLVQEKIPLLTLSAISIYLSALAVQRLGIVLSTETTPIKYRVANALVSYVKYIGKMFWPQDLTVFYPYPVKVPIWQALGAVLILIFVSYFLVWVLRRIPALGVGWLWYLGTLVPAIGLFQAGLWPAMADRWSYVPLIGLFVIIAWGVPELMTKWRYKVPGLVVMATILLAILMTITWLQVRYWKNSVTLFEHAVAVNVRNQLAHYNLGVALKKQGRITEAIDHFSEALQINPLYLEARRSLALALATQGRIAEAIQQYFEFLKENPGHKEAHNNLGVVLLQQGRTAEAIHHFSEALRLDTGYADAHYNLGIAMVRARRIEAAVAHFQAALQQKPYDPRIQDNLDQLLAPQGVVDDIIAEIKEKLELHPRDFLLHYQLGRLYKIKGDLNKAMDHYQQVLFVQPDFAPALNDLAIVHAMRGEYEQALSLLKKTIGIWPDHFEPYYDIACIYARQNKGDESMAWLKQAIDRGFKDWQRIKNDDNLENLRRSADYKTLARGQ
ncbi:MAG: tetratricopeptide repeat protein [Deltaproteobacteria bacterium]|nr:tetratricopeptide repeat protein [Deltaproteobacteria bacterium]